MAKLQGRSQVLKLLKEDEILKGVNVNFNKELGRGSYAAVYQAEWRGLSCVAKVFHAVIFPSYPAETWKQLAREIELLQHIRHPNIVQLLGFTETQSKIPYVVMECLDTNLTTLIKEHHSLLSFDIQVCILHDVAVGLNFLHEEPVIHRDLSSNNILLTEHLIAKISDLGLAKHIKSAEQEAGSFAGFGTQNYMPPEVLGQIPPQISPKTDVFSFGVVMLQLATGKSPDVRGRLNVDAEADRRKHHLDLLGEKNLFCPLVLQCLSESMHRPNASMLCEALKKFGIVRNSTLKLTKALQEEKVGFKKQLEAFQLQRDSDIENMQKQLQEKIMALQTKLDEEKAAETAMVDEIRKLNMRISELKSTEHMMKKSSSSHSEIERQYHQQIQEVEQKCAKQKDQIVNLEAICAMQQGESFEATKKELEQNKAVTAQLQTQITKLQTELQVCDTRYKQVVSNLEDAHQKQTDLLEESRAAMTKTLELTEENAKLHEQNFNLVEDIKSLTAKLQQQGGAVAGLPNDEELNALKKENARLKIQTAASNSFQPSGDIEAMKKSGGLLSTGKRSGEMSGSQERFMPAVNASPNYKPSPLSSGDISAHPGQKPVQPTLNAAPYGMYGDAAHLVGAQKPGINLENLAQERIRALQENLLTAEQERDESKRTMERSNAMLNNRIRRLEEQLTNGASNEIAMVDEIRKLNMRISELESTEHMMKESSSSHSEIERQYRQQLQEMKQKCAEQKDQIVNLEAICAMQQGESFEATKKELEQNKAVIAQLQTQITKLQTELQVCDTRYKQVVSNLDDAHQKQTDLLEESRAAMTKTMELTVENAKLHEQNFNLVEDMKSLTAKLQQQGGAIAGLPNDEELNALKKENAKLKIQALQEQLHTQGSGGGASGDVISKMSRYRDERNEALVQVQAKQAEIAKLNAIIAQMASSQAAQPSPTVFNRQPSEDQPSSLPSHSEVFTPESDRQLSISDVPSTQSSLESSGKHSDSRKVTNLSTPMSNNPWSAKKLPTTSSGALKQPSKQTAKSIIKQVETANGKQDVSCEPVDSAVEVKKGQRVVVCRTNSTEYGTVRAVDVIIDGYTTKKGYVGVEMDLPSGNTDGMVMGVYHFRCKPKHGIFVLLKNIYKIVE